jgi:TrpR family trp operon transcriptional repressor
MNELVKILFSIRDEKEMNEFLLGLFTEGEISEVTKRIEIVKKLKAGVPHQQIAKELGVGVATVTRGSKELQKGRFKQV